MAARLIACDCGRSIKALGWNAHAKACPIEQARHAAFIEAIDTGEDVNVATARAVREALAARDQGALR